MIHGHNYRVLVTVEGEPLSDTKHPKHGMVVDFSNLSFECKSIEQNWDHRFLITGDEPIVKLLDTLPNAEKSAVWETLGLQWVGFRTTAENMARSIFYTLSKRFNVVEVTVYETETACATYRSQDRDNEG